MKTYRGEDVQINVFFTSALFGGKLSVSRFGHSTPQENSPRTDTDWIRGLVGPIAYPDAMENGKFSILPGLELQPLGRPTYNQWLYRLNYLGYIRERF
jgi:hypothetical protein